MIKDKIRGILGDVFKSTFFYIYGYYYIVFMSDKLSFAFMDFNVLVFIQRKPDSNFTLMRQTPRKLILISVDIFISVNPSS